MNFLKVIYLDLVHLLDKIRSIPAAMADAAKRRQRRRELKESEVERLDRIRNPLKYRGR